MLLLKIITFLTVNTIQNMSNFKLKVPMIDYDHKYAEFKKGEIMLILEKVF